MSAIEITAQSANDTTLLAMRLAGMVEAGDVVALSGEVGAGKTTFAQGFIGSLLAAPEAITSPTFTLVQGYDTKQAWRVVHADLYRLKNANELEEIGLEDGFGQHVTLIEWPEIAEAILPHNTLYVQMEYVSEQCRRITLRSHSARWKNLLQDVAA
jgi:tRNA threonylcarbamoyl adenosine modification protein YjeE